MTNTGTADLTISSITNGNPAFPSSDNCPRSPSTIPPGDSCTITVNFAPTVWGEMFGAIALNSNALNGSARVDVTGDAYSGAVTLSSTSVNFGNVAIGQTVTQSVTLANSGDLPLYILNNFAFGGDENGTVTQKNNCPLSPSSLSPGLYCTITFSYTPTGAGGLALFMNMSDSAKGFMQTINLSGTGVGPAAILSSSALTFSSQAVGTTSAVRSATITNTGNANLTFSNVGITGTNARDFGVVTSGTTCSTSTSVAPNSNCVIQVAFTPTAVGSRSGTLSITDNVYNSPQSASLSGYGTDFAIAVANSTPSTATVTAGTSASYSLAVSPLGGFNQAITMSCTGAPSLATCSVSPASVTLDGTNAASVKVMVTTAAPTLAPPTPKQRLLPPLAWPSGAWLALLGLLLAASGGFIPPHS